MSARPAGCGHCCAGPERREAERSGTRPPREIVVRQCARRTGRSRPIRARPPALVARGADALGITTGLSRPGEVLALRCATVPSRLFVTKTPPAPIASAFGPPPSGIGVCASFVVGSIGVTVPTDSFVTQSIPNP